MSRSHCAWLVAFSLLQGGCRFLSGYADGRATLPQGTPEDAPGVVQFVFNDFHGITTDTLSTNAAPWELAAAATVLYRRSLGEPVEESEQGFKEVLTRRYGFLQPAALVNWGLPDPPPHLSKPLGLVTAIITRSLPTIRIEAVNQGCSTCHSSNLWDAQGQPVPGQAWIGAPSSSINLERYATELYAAFLYASAHPTEVVAAMDRLFPGMDPAERHSLVDLVLPRLQKQMAAYEQSYRRFQPYLLGGAGLTNGVGAMKVNKLLVGRERFLDEETSFTSIPDFGALRLRTSVLFDGVYVSPGLNRYGPVPADLTLARHEQLMGEVISLFTVGTLGADPNDAPDNIPGVTQAMHFAFEQYQPPPFPGPIDAARATAGRAVFQDRCSRCHGTYSEGLERVRLLSYPNQPVPQETLETDPTRWKRTHGLYQEKFARLPLSAKIEVAETDGYVATPLTSLWMSAPYLHNGSVPTLWHLMHPETRPARFQVGGHALDFTRVGIAGSEHDGTYAYPEGYVPWTVPDLYDTAQPGHANTGHTRQFQGMSEEEKGALIEYLKLL